MERRRRLTRQETRLMTRAILIEAAETVFLREGFGHSSVERITEEAGFSRGAFYSNFTDKDDIALAVIDKRRQEAAMWLKALHRIADPAEYPVAIRDWFSKLWRQRDWIALRMEFSREAARNPALEGRLAELCRQEIQTIAQSLRPKGRAAAVTALALVAACHGLGSLGLRGAPDLEQLCEAAGNLLFERVTGG